MPFLEEVLTSGFQQLQQRKPRSYRPWGCCLRPGSPSFQHHIRLSAALPLGRKGFSRSYHIIIFSSKHSIIATDDVVPF